MNKPIKASFKFTLDEFLLAQEILMRNSEMRHILRKAKLMGLAGGLGSLFYIVTKGVHPFALFILSMSAGLLMSEIFLRRTNIKHFEQRPDRELTINWDFAENHVVSKTEKSYSELNWNLFIKVSKTPQGFLLYQNDRLFHWIPVHAFNGQDDFKAASDLMKSKISRYEEFT